MTTWTIQTRTTNGWSIITIEDVDHHAAIRKAERLTGGRFVKIEA